MRNDLRNPREKFAGVDLPKGPKEDIDSGELNGAEIKTHAAVEIDEETLEHVVDALAERINEPERILNIRDTAFQLALDKIMETHRADAIHLVDGEYQLRDAVIPELQAETLRIALEIAPPKKLVQRVEEPKTSPANGPAESDRPVQGTGIADRVATEFIAAFSGAKESSVIKDIRRRIVGATDGIEPKEGGYWGNKHTVGEREGVFSALKNVFTRVTNELTQGWKGKDKARLAKALDHSESRPNLGKAIDLVVKQELTNAELEVGLRDKNASHSYKPGKVSPERYQEECYGPAAYSSAAAKIFTRLKNAFEQIGVKAFPNDEVGKASVLSKQPTERAAQAATVQKSNGAYGTRNTVANDSGGSGAMIRAAQVLNNLDPKEVLASLGTGGLATATFFSGENRSSSQRSNGTTHDQNAAVVPRAEYHEAVVREELYKLTLETLDSLPKGRRALPSQVAVALWDHKTTLTNEKEGAALVECAMEIMAKKYYMTNGDAIYTKELFKETLQLIANGIIYGTFNPAEFAVKKGYSGFRPLHYLREQVIENSFARMDQVRPSRRAA